MYFEDLTPLTCFGEGRASALRAVGWLEGGREFPQGEISRAAYDRIVELVRSRFEPFVAAGFHRCELCQFDGECGSGNLFVPHDGHLLVCPELITHYVAVHRYRPPDVFLGAIAVCPAPKTPEFRQRFLECGGRALLKK